MNERIGLVDFEFLPTCRQKK